MGVLVAMVEVRLKLERPVLLAGCGDGVGRTELLKTDETGAVPSIELEVDGRRDVESDTVGESVDGETEVCNTEVERLAVRDTVPLTVVFVVTVIVWGPGSRIELTVETMPEATDTTVETMVETTGTTGDTTLETTGTTVETTPGTTGAR